MRAPETREQVLDSARRSVFWLVGRHQLDGSIKCDVHECYKLPGVRQVTGHYVDASRLPRSIVYSRLRVEGWFSRQFQTRFPTEAMHKVAQSREEEEKCGRKSRGVAS